MEIDNKSYRQIVKSTGIFGGSQVVTIIIAIIRNKILAVLLGASGIGLISIYQNTLDLIRSVSGFGMENTGVKEIASVSQHENLDKLKESIYLIERWVFVFALLGGMLCLLFSYPISIWVFEDASYTLHICFLSISIFFSILSMGEMVVLQGLRRIPDMVKSTIISSVAGLVISLPMYYIFKEDGIIPAFIIVSISAYITTNYYRRGVEIGTVQMSLRTVIERGVPMIKVGFFIVISSVLSLLGFFLIRTMLNKDAGLGSVGLYQAAWAITNVYLMIILKSMGSDFYPRLCAIISDNPSTKKLVNEQTYIVLIVSVPIIILLFICSQWALSILYSSEFTSATDILNWQVLGTFFKVISWPLGFILLAKGEGRIYFFTEALYLVIYLGCSYFLYGQYGLEGIGISYLLAYLVYLSAVFLLGKKLSEFNWTVSNILIGFISFILVLLAFNIAQYYRQYIIIAGVPLLLISLCYSLYNLNKVIPIKSLYGFIKRDK